MDKTKKEEKKKVLYFDDEPFITQALAQSLELFGWDVILVSEIDVLFRELKTHQFNVLILDIMAAVPNSENRYVSFTPEEIDKMDNGLNVGIVLAKKIWYELKMNIPILFLSAKRNPIPEEPELDEIKCAYLRKPQLAKEVEKRLNELLS
jgi:DNA-binding response OmpR family regulator